MKNILISMLITIVIILISGVVFNNILSYMQVFIMSLIIPLILETREKFGGCTDE